MATIAEKELTQKLREVRDRKVCDDFKALAQKYPDATFNSLFDTLAERYRKMNIKEHTNYPMTGMGVKKLLIRRGMYNPA